MNQRITRTYLKKIQHGGFRSFIRRALELGLEVRLLSESPRILNIRYKDHSVTCVNATLPLLKQMGNVTKNKVTTKIILDAADIHVPKGILVRTLADALREIKKHRLSFPLITKPLNSSLATGVSWNIQTNADLKKGVAYIAQAQKRHKRISRDFLVEEMIPGDEYRVLVLGDQVLSCVKKVPATLIGDGVSTIARIIHTFNQTRARGFEIKLDAIAKASLKKNNLTLDSILAKDSSVKLRNNLNMSDGGRSIECLHLMSREFQDLCVRAVRVLGLTYGGIDLIAENITSVQSRHAFIEVNSNPFYNMHEKPLVEGDGKDISLILLKKIFPELEGAQ